MRLFALLMATTLAAPANAAPTLAPLFVDHAVLQRDMPIRISGTADAGERLTIVLGRDRVSVAVDGTGIWQVDLPARPGGANPVDLSVTGAKGARAEARDLLIGDVWLCSGQSNMEMQVARALNSYNEATAANDPLLRMTVVPRADPTQPAKRTAAPLVWKSAVGHEIDDFSAVCYYMAKALRESRKVPVGAIAASWGGTKIEKWLAGAPIYNGMIAPLGNYSLKGVVWYQGESDVGSTGYRDRLSSLMKTWRSQFGQSALPFLIVGLANFEAYATTPVQSSWAELREEQRHAVLRDPHAALVPAFDVGERTDVHPANKQAVGQRLASAALALAYGEIGGALPVVLHAKSSDAGSVTVSFANVKSALHSWSGNAVLAFELCDAGACRFADARASGSTVILAGDGKPVSSIRYGWADSPVINLYDERALPPGPFQVQVEP